VILDSITVERYRSITAAKRIRVGRSTILVGPNNEGKSNILRALVLAMNVISTLRRYRGAPLPTLRRMRVPVEYDWEQDFPIHLQNNNPKSPSVISLEFQLTPTELVQFRATTGSALTGSLPLKISIGPDGVDVAVHKKGAGGPALTKKAPQIAAFVADRIDFLHIPAVRTANSAQRIVTDLVDRALRGLEDNKEYVRALKKIAELQEPLLKVLSAEVKSTLVQFLPAVNDVQIRITEEARHSALRRGCQIEVNDGSATLLQHKGDGVQSLAALALMRQSSEVPGRNLVIAIEEPESHLHPNAIHELRIVLNQLAEKHQVVLTTHNPLFVDRVHITSNIIVNRNRARPAASIEEVRNVLGVRASDNLRHADLVLLVEGDEDRIAVQALLSSCSATLSRAFNHSTMVIDTLGGGSNLAYKLALLRDSLCLTHSFLDDDECGREAFERARREGLASDANVNFATCAGKSEAELEDWYDPALYSAALMASYRVDVANPKFRSSKKWSDRVREVFRANGKLWNDRVECQVKRRVAELVAADPARAVLAQHRSALDGLVRGLEQRLEEIRRSRR
jgi:putative ATP-dependent endonuclease of OLD family